MKGFLLLLSLFAIIYTVEKEDLTLVFNKGKYQVNVIDVDSGKYDSPRQFRIYEPKGAVGKVPVVHFLHGFQLKHTYYDDLLTHLSSHGFIVISGQSEHKLIGGDTSIKEAEKVYVFITWLKGNLAKLISVTPDFTNVGLSGHSRGCKVLNRVLNSYPKLAVSFFGIDPVDSAPTLSDKKSLKDSVQFKGESMFIGTEMGSKGLFACAPKGDNSVDFYDEFPSPSHHIIASNVGHMDMIDQSDISACGIICSMCSWTSIESLSATFSTYIGGLMAAFFSSTLKGETKYQTLLNDASNHPFPTILVEHK